MQRAWLVILLLFVACGSSEPRRRVVPSGQKILLADQSTAAKSSDTVRFGRMHTGEVAVLPLLLANESEQPLVLVRYDRTCGCTTLEYENQPIKASEVLPAKITFDARGIEGWQFKVLTLHFAGRTEPFRLYVEAEVE